ncbi:hypothetical protein BD414DRAFT_94007 [Trametes punicea]|nr:hypothetical protein BD414DRAFT_94007 [Trametes punicea]
MGLKFRPSWPPVPLPARPRQVPTGPPGPALPQQFARGNKSSSKNTQSHMHGPSHTTTAYTRRPAPGVRLGRTERTQLPQLRRSTEGGMRPLSQCCTVHAPSPATPSDALKGRTIYVTRLERPHWLRSLTGSERLENPDRPYSATRTDSTTVPARASLPVHDQHCTQLRARQTSASARSTPSHRCAACITITTVPPGC